jgi:hypothetical protein
VGRGDGIAFAPKEATSSKETPIKHVALVTIASGLVSGWLMPGDIGARASTYQRPLAVEAMSQQHRDLPEIGGNRSAGSTSLRPQTKASAAETLSHEILRLAAQADRLDEVWQIYKAECGVVVDREYAFGREWFSLWDGSAKRLSSGSQCAEIPKSLADGSDALREDLRNVVAAARLGGVDTATEVGLLRWNMLQPATFRR